jgi:hypothetical protein
MYEPHPNPDVCSLDAAFTGLCRSLLQQQIDYDIVDERSVAGASIDGKKLVLGEQTYHLLVLPPMDTVRLPTMETIVRFVEGGGSVFAHSQLPMYAADGSQDDDRIRAMAKRMRAAGALGGSAPGSPPLGYLVKSRIPSECHLSPSSPNVLCTMLRRTEGPAHFLVNVSSKEYSGTCTFRSAGEPVLFDPSSGNERALKREKSGSSLVRVPITLQPFESLFVLFRYVNDLHGK